MKALGARIRRIAIGRSPKRTVIRAGATAVALFIVFRFVVTPVVTRGISMEPTFRDGTPHLVNPFRYRRHDPAPGDVVVISLAGRRVFYLKRVLAGPGERVAFDGGRLMVDGAARPEPYLADRGDWTMPEVALGPDEFFVAGDNRSVPIEEHKVGVVRREKIMGGILF